MSGTIRWNDWRTELDTETGTYNYVEESRTAARLVACLFWERGVLGIRAAQRNAPAFSSFLGRMRLARATTGKDSATIRELTIFYPVPRVPIQYPVLRPVCTWQQPTNQPTNQPPLQAVPAVVPSLQSLTLAGGGWAAGLIIDRGGLVCQTEPTQGSPSDALRVGATARDRRDWATGRLGDWRMPGARRADKTSHPSRPF